MAKFDVRKLAARIAGRPSVPEFAVVSGAGANTNIALNDRNGKSIQKEDMLANVIDLTTGTEQVANTSVTSIGNIQCTNSTAGHMVLVVWYKVRPGL